MTIRNDDSGLSNNNSSGNENDEDDLDEVPCSQEVNETKLRRTFKQSRSSSFESKAKNETSSFTIPATQAVQPALNPSDSQAEENFYIPETQEVNNSREIKNMNEKKEASDFEDDDYFQFNTEDLTGNTVEESQNIFSFMKATKDEDVKKDDEHVFDDDDEDDEISKLEWNDTTRKSSSLQAIKTDNSMIDEKEGRTSVTPELFLTAQSTTSNKNGERNRILDTICFESQDIDSQSICGKPVNVNNVNRQNRAGSITPDLNLDGVKEVSS